ncbi:MAG: ABC transporter ATP-binding protein [Bacteroidetes bacterium]|nr:ABC transporter ATP-binding protein [Bacteroidota bacterium]
MLHASGLCKRYGQLEVLKGIDFRLMQGQATALVGASGAGKSTLLQLLGTLDYPDAGEVYFKHERLDTQNPKAQARFRNRHLGFVFQFHHLLPEFTALENAAMPAYIAGVPRKEAEQRAAEWLAWLGLAERLHHKPGELSGGEQQRTAVARALINQPDLLLADEPTGNLDSENGERLFRLFLQLAEEKGVTLLIATHNPDFARRCHRQLYIRDGLLSEQL